MPSASFPPGVAEVVPAEDAREPERWLVAACWALIVFCVVQVLLFGYGREQTAQALAGEALLRGGVPYVDVADPSAPGIFFLHAALQGALGKSMLALRLVEALGLLGQALCLVWLGGVLFGSRTAGVLGAALATLLHAQLEFWHTGRPESFAGFLTVAALLVTVRSGVRVPGQAALLGLLAAAVGLFQPALASFVLVCAAYLARRLQATRGTQALLLPGAILAACLLTPLCLTAGWFAAHGALSEFWQALRTVPSPQAEAAWAGRSAPELFYAAMAEAAVGFSALIAVGLLAACMQRPLFAREREGLFLVFGLLSVQLAAIALEGELAVHHFGATLPLLAFVSGLGWFKLWRRLSSTGVSGMLAFASFLFVVGAMQQPVTDLPQGFWQRSALRTGYILRVGPLTNREELERELMTRGDYDLPHLRRVSSELTEELAPTDRLYVASDEPMLYWLTPARPAHSTLRGAGLPPAPGAAHPLADARAALARALAESQPSHVLVPASSAAATSAASPGATRAPTVQAIPSFSPASAVTAPGVVPASPSAVAPPELQAHYEPRAHADGYTLYVRKDAR
jgi:hypothetical protein